MTYEEQQNYLSKKIWPVVSTETLLRKWKRRLLVALTDDEINKCKYHIKLYS